VLVVEDEADCRDLLTEALTTFGAEVSSASTCEDALEHIRQSAPGRLPHVILSDLGMPTSDGFDLIHRLRMLRSEAGGRIPAIAVTGYANPEDRQRALAAGYDGHLAKPIDPSEVALAVRRIVLK
jgi:CheY-like chemotaxis protein